MFFWNRIGLKHFSNYVFPRVSEMTRYRPMHRGTISASAGQVWFVDVIVHHGMMTEYNAVQNHRNIFPEFVVWQWKLPYKQSSTVAIRLLWRSTYNVTAYERCNINNVRTIILLDHHMIPVAFELWRGGVNYCDYPKLLINFLPIEKYPRAGAKRRAGVLMCLSMQLNN